MRCRLYCICDSHERSAKDAINVETAFHKAARAAMVRIPEEPTVAGDSVDIKKIEAEKGRGCCG